MRVLALLIVGVVVGWAASGVDWSREAVGQDTFNATTDSEVPAVPKGGRFIAAPTDPMMIERPASENFSRPRQWPRRVFETRMEIDANGQQHVVKVSRLVNADGSIVPEPTPPAENLVGRFQATAYGSPNGHGCYIVDTMTGKTWHVANGQLQPHIVTEGLSQTQVPTPAYNQPAVAPTPSNSEPSIRQSAPLKSAVEPTPLQGPEPTDAE